jgi:hypothetical protein
MLSNCCSNLRGKRDSKSDEFRRVFAFAGGPRSRQSDKYVWIVCRINNGVDVLRGSLRGVACQRRSIRAPLAVGGPPASRLPTNSSLSSG